MEDLILSSSVSVLGKTALLAPALLGTFRVLLCSTKTSLPIKYIDPNLDYKHPGILMARGLLYYRGLCRRLQFSNGLLAARACEYSLQGGTIARGSRRDGLPLETTILANHPIPHGPPGGCRLDARKQGPRVPAFLVAVVRPAVADLPHAGR
jgi:hypothetical protein